MKRILMIGTGGTIASEETREGLEPGIDARHLIDLVPAIETICDVDCLELFCIDSTDMTPSHWLTIARTIRSNYERYDGFVISHGTDTMAFTAAALSYLIQNSKKPIVLTGAQKPIGFESTDSKINLLDAFLCASSDMPGVQLVFNGKIILGTRARKTHTKSYAAFSSINHPDLGAIQNGRLIRYIRQPYKKTPVFYDALNDNIALIKLIPGMRPDLLRFACGHHDAVIIESFGVGGLPKYDNLDYYECIREYVASGHPAVVTTQVANEGSDLSVYNTGWGLKHIPGILEAYDMSTEAIVAKMMWILGHTQDIREIASMFYTSVALDMLDGQK